MSQREKSIRKEWDEFLKRVASASVTDRDMQRYTAADFNTAFSFLIGLQSNRGYFLDEKDAIPLLPNGHSPIEDLLELLHLMTSHKEQEL